MISVGEASSLEHVKNRIGLKVANNDAEQANILDVDNAMFTSMDDSILTNLAYAANYDAPGLDKDSC